MRITIARDRHYAPCAYLLCMVDDAGKWDTRDESRTRLVQADTDLPALATDFGYVDATGGNPTVSVAAMYLDCIAGDGVTIEDPGYFGGAA